MNVPGTHGNIKHLGGSDVTLRASQRESLSL